METVGVEPTPPRCKRGALPIELHPQVRTGGVEPPQREALRLQRRELSNAQHPQGKEGAVGRIRTGTSRITTSGAAVTSRPPRRRWRLCRRRPPPLEPTPKFERRKIIMGRAAGRIFRRRAGRIRTGTSRTTTSGAAVTPRPPRRRCRLRRRRPLRLASTPKSNAGKSSWPRSGRIFRRRAGTTGLEPARARLTSECSQPLSYVPNEVAPVGFEPTVSSS